MKSDGARAPASRGRPALLARGDGHRRSPRAKRCTARGQRGGGSVAAIGTPEPLGGAEPFGDQAFEDEASSGAAVAASTGSCSSVAPTTKSIAMETNAPATTAPIRVERLRSQKRSLQSLQRYGECRACANLSSEQQPDRRTLVLRQAGHHFMLVAGAANAARVKDDPSLQLNVAAMSVGRRLIPVPTRLAGACVRSARGRTRTGMALRPRNFKSLAYTRFATRAGCDGEGYLLVPFPGPWRDRGHR